MNARSVDRGTLVDLTLGAIAISWAAIFLRFAGGDPLLASAMRLAIAAVILLPFAIARLRSRPLSARLVRAAVLGGALYAAHFASWVASLQRTSVAASVTLVTATPALLAVIGLLRRRDPPKRSQGIAIAITALGVLVIGASDVRTDADALLGDALALAGAIAMALYFLVARELGAELDPWVLNAISTAIGAVILGALLVVASGIGARAWAIPDREWLGWIALSAIVPQGIGHSLLTRALLRATPTAVGLATCAEPVISTLLAVPLLGEVPSITVAIGCAITLAGVLLGARF